MEARDIHDRRGKECRTRHPFPDRVTKQAQPRVHLLSRRVRHRQRRRFTARQPRGAYMPTRTVATYGPPAGFLSPTLLFKLSFLRCIGGALEVNAVAIRIDQRHHPEAVSDKGTSARLDSA